VQFNGYGLNEIAKMKGMDQFNLFLELKKGMI